MADPADDLTKLIDSIAKTRAAAQELKVAEVVYLEEGAARLQFVGDTTPTSKLFKTLGALTDVGDFVICAPVGGSYVILGKLGGAWGGDGIGGGSCGCYHVGPRSTYTTINAAVRAAVADTPDGGAAAICIHDKGSPYQEVVYLSDWNPPEHEYEIYLPRDIHLFFQGHGSMRPVWDTAWLGHEPSGYYAVGYWGNEGYDHLRTASFENIRFTGSWGPVENANNNDAVPGTTCIAKNCQWILPGPSYPTWSFISWWREGHVYIEDCEFWGNDRGGWLASLVWFGSDEGPRDNMLLAFRGNTVYQFEYVIDLTYPVGAGCKAWIYDNRFIECDHAALDLWGGWDIDVHDNDVIDCGDGFALVRSAPGCTATGYVGPNSFRGSPGARPQEDETDLVGLLTVGRMLQGPSSKRPATPPPDVKWYHDSTTPHLYWWNETQWIEIS